MDRVGKRVGLWRAFIYCSVQSTFKASEIYSIRAGGGTMIAYKGVPGFNFQGLCVASRDYSSENDGLGV